MTTRLVAPFRAAPMAAARVVTMPRPRVPVAPVRLTAQRPQQLQSEFLSPVATLTSMFGSFARAVLSASRSALAAGSRLPLLVQCNNKKGLGCTLGGTRRKRARVSGFRARAATVGGKRVLAARRKKGRKALCPAAVPKRKV